MTEINVHLFSKPEVEIDLEKARPEDFKQLGNELMARLNRVAEIVEKLEKNKWERSAGIYDLTFYKKIKIKEAREEIKNFGIKEDEIEIMEEEFDEDEVEESDDRE